MTTEKNLNDAFAGESQACHKYLAFAERAEQEGLPQVARLFRAAARAETVHALAHLRAMNVIKSTAENLKEAIRGEAFECKEMYPEYVRTAMDEGRNVAMLSFNNAMEVERVHHRLYVAALNELDGHPIQATSHVCVCQTCGNTVLETPPKHCPICNAPRDSFTEVP
jgi:rubrerythrin